MIVFSFDSVKNLGSCFVGWPISGITSKEFAETKAEKTIASGFYESMLILV